MREIIFRGYSRIDNQWHFGDLNCKYVKDGYAQIDEFSVDKDSIGQYTGFEDKCGSRIFEGDIISNGSKPEHKYIIMWSRGCWLIKDTYDLTELFLSSIGNYMQVVSNIYEEKLKESK